MYIDFPTSEYVTKPTNEPHNERLPAVNFTFSSLVPITVPLPESRTPHYTIRGIEYLQPIVTPTVTDTDIREESKTLFNNAVVTLVVIVVLVWIIVIGVVLKNKIEAKRKRRMAREPPSYSDVQVNSNSTSDFLDTGMNPTLELSEMSESSVVDIVSSLDDAPSFVSYQPSAPNQVSTENSVSEELPSYVEIQEQSSHMTKTNSKEEEPPSYMEAILQRVMQEKRS